MSGAAGRAMVLAVHITSDRVTVEDESFLDPEEYRRCAGRWCHTVTADEGEEDVEVHHFISPDYEEAAEFAIVLAREHRCKLHDHSQVEP